MAQEDINSLEVQETKLKGLYEVYKDISAKIDEELKVNDAAQEEFDKEQNITLQTQDEISAARAIIKQKRQQWLDAVKEKQEEEKEKKKFSKSSQDDGRPHRSNHGGHTGTSYADSECYNNSFSSSFSSNTTINQIAATSNKAF
ncbi:hypothetical protein DAPPUDRAFT_266034 [Daphnia pulex]|uniref:Uncharacterized protein n=1 Tax=Daphnia pulex TaxID=6669 RepID=E9HUD8_DAPPU|nr:hypothetical protein DAPPUDRAFT_266034 [Daphnia pulex]|eukprot:EFX64645.1 hypothetical protein DAPPUDRAFT_266034 [Daphnia pulex]